MDVFSVPEDEPCHDCGTHHNVRMRNSREVRYGFLWLKVKTERFPGFLCISCWKLANPKLFSPKVMKAINETDSYVKIKK